MCVCVCVRLCRVMAANSNCKCVFKGDAKGMLGCKPRGMLGWPNKGILGWPNQGGYWVANQGGYWVGQTCFTFLIGGGFLSFLTLALGLAFALAFVLAFVFVLAFALVLAFVGFLVLLFLLFGAGSFFTFFLAAFRLRADLLPDCVLRFANTARLEWSGGSENQNVQSCQIHWHNSNFLSSPSGTSSSLELYAFIIEQRTFDVHGTKSMDI